MGSAVSGVGSAVSGVGSDVSTCRVEWMCCCWSGV